MVSMWVMSAGDGHRHQLTLVASSKERGRAGGAYQWRTEEPELDSGDTVRAESTVATLHHPWQGNTSCSSRTPGPPVGMYSQPPGAQTGRRRLRHHAALSQVDRPGLGQHRRSDPRSPQRRLRPSDLSLYRHRLWKLRCPMLLRRRRSAGSWPAARSSQRCYPRRC